MPLNWRKDLPAKRSLTSYQATATPSYAPSKSSLVAEVAFTRNVRKRWMADVDVALNDEGQQYGNLDEVSAIARILRKGIVIWCGDHKQTPGGLRKSEEARVFRRKLMRRPIALRGDTTFLPPHMLGAIVHPYVKDVPGPQMAGVSQLLQESTKQPFGLSTGWERRCLPRSV